MPFNERNFWSKVDETDTCWLWRGYINKDGYGEFRSQFLTTRLAHRISYALDKGQMPELPLDHLCRHRHCVNPDHLEPVTQLVNTRRSNVGMNEANKTECPQGHPYDDENTLRYGGKRICRTCKRERAREYRAKKKQTKGEDDGQETKEQGTKT